MSPSIPQQVRVGVGVFVLKSTQEPADNPTFLVGRRKGSHGSGTYALPGGHIEYGEGTEACAARELLEETGLTATGLRPLTNTNDYFLVEDKHYITLFLVCTRKDESQEPQILEPDKCDGWEWIQWREVVKWVVGAEEAPDRKVFLPLVNLIKQRPGVVPVL